MRRSAAPLCLALLLASRAAAIVIHGGTGTENFSAPTGSGPAGDPGFANVGDRGVYLGNYGGNHWVLTATHVGAGDIKFGATTYTFAAGSALTVLNNDSSPSDLLLFRITSDPGLPTLNLLSGTAPPVSSIVRMVGDGRTEGTSTFTNWGVTLQGGTNDDIWTPGGGTDKSGYTTVPGSGMRWGDSAVTGYAPYDVGTGSTAAFYMQFSSVTGNSMGQVGDSGGAAFYYNSGDSTWYLAGILGAVGLFHSPATPDNQPANTAVFGNLTFAASIPAYHAFITSAIPEPSAYAAALGVFALAVAVWRRQQAR